jgi:hypothetical protein
MPIILRGLVVGLLTTIGALELPPRLPSAGCYLKVTPDPATTTPHDSAESDKESTL